MKNQNYIHEEIKCRLKAENSCYSSVQARLPSQLLKIRKLYKTISPVALYGCETLVSCIKRGTKTKNIWDEYPGPRWKRMGSGEGFAMKNFISIHLT